MYGIISLSDPSAAALEPIVTSGYLKGSLVIIVAVRVETHMLTDEFRRR